MNLQPLKFQGDFIDGQFQISSKSDGQIIKFSPADLKDKVLAVEFSYDHVNRAVESAARAFKGWRDRPMEERIQAVLRIKKQFEENEKYLAEVISRETGKPTWESLTEVKAMIAKVTVTVEQSLKLVEEIKVENALPQVNGYIRFRPRGVLAVLGPFNFPGHLPNGHIIPALVTGNTVVFKPSELTPATGQAMAEIMAKADLPPGVFNLVQGAAESGRRLVDHDKVDGVLFTGSYEVGLKIKEKTMTSPGKILALEMGGKNTTIVWKDSEMNKALYESLIGAFLTAGQRCSCTSRIILHKSIAATFLEHFYNSTKRLSIGHWSENAFMGPLISEGAVEKYIRFQDIATREGAEKIMRGKPLETKFKGHYVTPSIYKVNKFDEKSVYQTHEIFGPNVAIYETEDLDEALHINRAPGFGLVTSIFSKSKDTFNHVFANAHSGLVNWNRTTNGASSRLPFGGLGKSGNDRPSAHFAVYYCTVPVASLEDETPYKNEGHMPGMNFEPL